MRPRHPLEVGPVRRAAVWLALCLALASCTVLPNIRGSDCSQDGQCPDGFACFPDFRCYEYDADPPCKPPCYGAEPFCDKATLRCIGCRDDADCAAGSYCAPTVKRCKTGCTEARPDCPAGERCDFATGQCKGMAPGCQADAACTDPFKPRCDVRTGQCVACLPGRTDCPSGSFCVEAQGGFRCMQGCTTASECPAGGPGQVMACCDHRCVDVLSESGHCGACGNTCQGAEACCDGVCTDLTRSPSHCGGCGRSCYLPNVTGVRCANSTCSNRGCEQYFGNCDGDLARNGCEVNHSFSPIHCGSCGNVCSAPPHRQPMCVLLSCSWSGPCEVGWGDCDGNSLNGCERSLTTTTDCGACNAPCAANQSCVSGACQ
jgi:hypothetical protein